MQKTPIEWTTETWNPLAGCTEKSPGCANCYAAVMAHRLEAMGQEKYAGTTKKLDNGKVIWTGRINLAGDDDDALTAPLRRRTPTTFFVNSMSDLFWGDDEDLETARRRGIKNPQPIPDEFIDKVFAVMMCCPHHTFQILTKRPERKRDYLRLLEEEKDLQRWLSAASEITGQKLTESNFDHGLLDWPLRHIWAGVSVEDRQRKARIDVLRDIPAGICFLSIEPLLEDLGTLDLRGVDWVIVGGESGSHARPCNVDWIRSIIQQCRAAGVPVFVKQLGSLLHARSAIDPIDQFPGKVKFGQGPDELTAWVKLKHPKGGDPREWPADLRIREFPAVAGRGERHCRVCGCTDADCSGCVERTGQPCSWVEADLCSACVAPAGRRRLASKGSR